MGGYGRENSVASANNKHPGSGESAGETREKSGPAASAPEHYLRPHATHLRGFVAGQPHRRTRGVMGHWGRRGTTWTTQLLNVEAPLLRGAVWRVACLVHADAIVVSSPHDGAVWLLAQVGALQSYSLFAHEQPGHALATAVLCVYSVAIVLCVGGLWCAAAGRGLCRCPHTAIR